VSEEKNGGNHDAPKSNVVAETSAPARASAVPELLEFVAAIERQEGFSAERIEEIAAALREALEIIVTRAYRERTGEIRITCKHDQWGKLVVVITDTGEPLNILLSDVVFPGEEPLGDGALRASARLIKKMIDNIEYKRVDRENTLSFFLSPELRRR